MSGRKLNLLPYQTIVSGNMALASITSAVTNILFHDNIGFEFDWTGSSPVGSIAIQVSYSYFQDQNGNVISTGTWTALTLSPAASVSGASGSIVIDLNQLSAPWIRAVYTKVSGTGTLNAWVGAKTV